MPPLRTPDPERLPALADLAEIPAVALLVQRARAAGADVALDAATAPALATLCRRLDGLPLTIELAAPRLTVLSPETLARRLTSRLRVLTGGARDLPERQQTLRATLEWSYALLSPGEQALFRRLSVFAGGCALEAAEAVGAPAGGEEENAVVARRDVADRLAALVDRSLVYRETAAAGAPRFGMLETVREYGRDALAEAGETERVRQAHVAHYLTLAEEAEPALIGPEQVAWGARLEREHANLGVALGWGIASGGSPTTAVRLAGALWRFWLVRGRLTEGRAWLERALDAGSDASPALRVKVVNGAGYLAWAQGDYRRATAAHGESLIMARELEDRAGIASALNNLGLVAVEQRDDARAAALFAESLRLRRALGDPVGIVNSLNNIGRVASEQGDYRRATALFTESLRLRRELRDTWGIATALEKLGRVAHAQGDDARAAALLEESLAVLREFPNSLFRAHAIEEIRRLVDAWG